MTSTTNSAGSAVSANRGVKRGLPDTGLKEAEKAAKSLWEIARLGLTSPQAFAAKLGRKGASGGGWSALMALLRGFGLVREQGEQIGLSDNGQALVNDSDPERQTAARRQAVMKLKAYRELVLSFDGTALPDAPTLAQRLKFDYGKTDEFASKAANAFIESLRHARMIDDTGYVRSNGAENATELNMSSLAQNEGGTQDDVAANAEEERFTAEIDEAFARGDDDEDDGLGDVKFAGGFKTVSTGSLAVTVNVSLDLSKYRVDEVIEILKALRE